MKRRKIFDGKKVKNKGGRPSKMTPEIIGKLEEVFSIDGTIAEACFYANINPDTYHSWIKKSKKLSDRFIALRNKPNLKARQEIIKGLDGNPEFSLKYLERKLSDEFTIKTKTELTGKDGENTLGIVVQFINGKNSKKIKGK